MVPVCVNSQCVTQLSYIKGCVLSQGYDSTAMAGQQGLQLFLPEWKIWGSFRNKGTFHPTPVFVIYADYAHKHKGWNGLLEAIVHKKLVLCYL